MDFLGSLLSFFLIFRPNFNLWDLALDSLEPGITSENFVEGVLQPLGCDFLLVFQVSLSLARIENNNLWQLVGREFEKLNPLLLNLTVHPHEIELQASLNLSHIRLREA